MAPSRLVAVLRELRRWGASPAGGIAAAAAEDADRVALIDDAGPLTAGQLHARSNALARALAEVGVRPGDGVAIMCRNHRGFVDLTLGCAKLGATALYLNTGFAAPELVAVIESERPSALIHDGEFAELFADTGPGLQRFVAWGDDGDGEDPRIEEMIASQSGGELEPPEQEGSFVVLTSGATGTPRGAQRPSPNSLLPLAALLSVIPLRAREPTVIAAPMFHSWGLAHFILGLALNSTYVVQRRFDPEQTLRAIAETKATGLVLVPVMMQRILGLPADVRRGYELTGLRVTAVSGAALPGELARNWMDEFGGGLYNLYGSTEVAWATIASPEDLRAAPGTAGRPPRGTRLRIVDERGRDVERGRTGRIFVGNEMAFEGYTGGGGKEALGGLLSSGDVGHLDPEGRLFIDGRDDEMIVSGGENVFPREVEDLLARQEGIEEVAVIGVADEEYGQRLKAFVVLDAEAELTEEEIGALVRAQLARYKVPREVELLDSLPRTATGKVLKRELT